MSYFVRSITRCRQEKREKEKKEGKKKTQRQRHATIALKVNLRLVQSRRQMEGGQIDLDGSVMVVLLQLQGGKGGGAGGRSMVRMYVYRYKDTRTHGQVGNHAFSLLQRWYGTWTAARTRWSKYNSTPVVAPLTTILSLSRFPSFHSFRYYNTANGIPLILRKLPCEIAAHLQPILCKV